MFLKKILFCSVIALLGFLVSCVEDDEDSYRLLAANDFDLNISSSALIPVENTLELCIDGEDNDMDGEVDCLDEDCKTLTVCIVGSSSSPLPEFEDTVEECSDGIDNDLDSKIDCEDEGCEDLQACNKTSSSAPQPVFENTYDDCRDGLDNDGNGDVDCADEGCKAIFYCNVQSSSSTEMPNFEDTAEECSNEIDDDKNGDIDCDDENCEGFEFCQISSSSIPEIEDGPAECSDNEDNDGDNIIDCDEEECMELAVCISSSGEPLKEDTYDECSDFIDNDGDGKIDCADEECLAWDFCGMNSSDSDPDPDYFIDVERRLIIEDGAILEVEDFVDADLALDSGWNLVESTPDELEAGGTGYRDDANTHGIDLAGGDGGIVLQFVRRSEALPYAVEVIDDEITFTMTVRAASGFLGGGGDQPPPYTIPIRFVHPGRGYRHFGVNYFQIDDTGSWEAYDTFDGTSDAEGETITEITLSKGQYIMEMLSTEGAYNINYWQFHEK